MDNTNKALELHRLAMEEQRRIDILINREANPIPLPSQMTRDDLYRYKHFVEMLQFNEEFEPSAFHNYMHYLCSQSNIRINKPKLKALPKIPQLGFIPTPVI